jgi:hypothetical protein
MPHDSTSTPPKNTLVIQYSRTTIFVSLLFKKITCRNYFSSAGWSCPVNANLHRGQATHAAHAGI